MNIIKQIPVILLLIVLSPIGVILFVIGFMYGLFTVKFCEGLQYYFKDFQANVRLFKF